MTVQAATAGLFSTRTEKTTRRQRGSALAYTMSIRRRHLVSCRLHQTAKRNMASHAAFTPPPRADPSTQAHPYSYSPTRSPHQPTGCLKVRIKVSTSPETFRWPSRWESVQETDPSGETTSKRNLTDGHSYRRESFHQPHLQPTIR